VRVVSTRAELRAARGQLMADGRTLGFVPTMGYLHAGHMALVEQARAECDTVAVSIFVNPAQFGPNEDLAAYPRDLDRDLGLLEGAGVDLVFTPGVTDIYPPGASTWVDVGGVAEVLEGAHRPGHFRGVATVVTILFQLVGPGRAYFGQKDAQQLAVIRQMVRDLGTPVEVVGCPTVREPDGLAMSSRNAYLGPEDREAAVCLSRALRAAEQAWADGEENAEALRGILRDVLAAEPRAQVEYVSVAHPDTLVELDEMDPAVGALASMTVRVGTPRLIDNVVLAPRDRKRNDFASSEGVG
jgi:pantoate--beta-alanine ligase